MARFIKKRASKVGLPPGSPVHIGEKRTEEVGISLIDYDEKQFAEKAIERIEDSFPFKDKPTVTWINIDGVHRTDNIEKIGDNFGLHPLTREDIVNTGQRPKMEDFGSYIYFTLKMLMFDEDEAEVKAEQVSLILGNNFVISFQEQPGDVFEAVRQRIRGAKGRVRKMGADYLAYSLLDAVVDNYFIILERLGEQVESLEEKLVEDVQAETLRDIRRLKSEMIFLRKSVWPLREVVSSLQRGGSALISESTNVYLRDVYDHTIQVIDTIEAYRDMLSGLLDIYLSSISNKMNAVMKVLTIIATIFIPLTFVAGVYGMNFAYMPELQWQIGYPLVLIVMTVLGVIMLMFFRKKKWL
ncbi:MAG: magnesium/cobalt transporter CorA [Planctomycetota bacterium]